MTGQLGVRAVSRDGGEILKLEGERPDLCQGRTVAARKPSWACRSASAQHGREETEGKIKREGEREREKKRGKTETDTVRYN